MALDPKEITYIMKYLLPKYNLNPKIVNFKARIQKEKLNPPYVRLLYKMTF